MRTMALIAVFLVESLAEVSGAVRALSQTSSRSAA